MATSFFGGSFFNGEFFNGYVPPTPTPPEYLDGQGSGGSDKAGKKKLRRGHAISAIQSGAYLEAFPLVDILPDETPLQEAFTDQVEAVIVEQALQIKSLEQLLTVITEALKDFEVTEQKTKSEKAIRAAQVIAYKEQVRVDYERIQIRRKKEEDALMFILRYV